MGSDPDDLMILDGLILEVKKFYLTRKEDRLILLMVMIFIIIKD